MSDEQKKPLLPMPPPYPYISSDLNNRVHLAVLGDGRLTLRLGHNGEVVTLDLVDSKRLALSILAPFL